MCSLYVEQAWGLLQSARCGRYSVEKSAGPEKSYLVTQRSKLPRLRAILGYNL